MDTYGKFAPTAFDSSGAFLPNRQYWLVLPVSRNRDSGPFDESNFQSALARLGGESRTVEVHRFGHWANGWFEVILVNPKSKKASIAADIESDLERYPILDDSDYSEREFSEYLEAWDNWGCSEFRDSVKQSLGVDDCSHPAIDARIDAIDSSDLLRYFESLNDCGDYYITESTGVYVNIESSARNVTLGNLLPIIRA